MKLRIVTKSLVGETVASRIYNANGNMLMNSGVVLSPTSIMHLRNAGLNTVYIKDDNNDITLQEVIEAPIYLKLLKDLKAEFTSIKKQRFVNENAMTAITTAIINSINMSENAFLPSNIGENDDSMKLEHHSLNVAIMSTILGANKGYDENKLKNLTMGALLHDIGKLFTDGDKHTDEGYRVARANSFISPTATITIIQHHEQVDGKGQRGIKGDTIHEHARIVAICDAYVNEQLEGELLPHQVLEKICAQAERKFDSDIYREFAQTVYCYPNGLEVQLNNGQKGIVSLQNRSFPARPMVKLADNQYANLMKDLTLFIDKVIVE